MTVETNTHPVLDTTTNFWRNAAFTGALLWGFNDSWRRALTMSTVTLPLISYVGYLRSNTQICNKMWTVSTTGNRLWNATLADPLIHLIDVALIYLTRKSLLAAPVTTVWVTGRLVSLWPHEKLNSRHHDSPLLGFQRMRNAFSALSKKLA